MITLRCTRKLQKHIGVEPELEDVEPTSALGDWYGNLVHMPEGPPLILVTNERSLLSVVLGHHADPRVALWRRIAALLRRLGCPKEAVEREIFHLQQMRVGKTRNRRVLGSMNDAVMQLEYLLFEGPRETVEQAEESLAENLYSMLDHVPPVDVALELLGAPPRPNPRPGRVLASEAEPDLLSALDLLSRVLDAPPGKPRRIARGQRVPVELSPRDRELLGSLDDWVCERGFTLDELGDLVRSLANQIARCESETLQRELDGLHTRLKRAAESYDDGHRDDRL